MKCTRFSLVCATAAACSIGALAFQTVDAGAKPSGSLRHALSTKVIKIHFENQKGEPAPKTAIASFDRDIESYWVSVVGQDVKFTHSTEKQINRVLFEVDPFGKIINGKDIEITGKLGIKDGSFNFDDNYEGTLTVAVTAILGDR